jgi:protein SCO1
MNQPVTATLRIFSIVVLLVLCVSQTVMADARYHRTVENYKVPDVVLINENGDKIHLKEYLQSDKPVILDFIFGTCTTICPVLSASFVNLQRKLGADAQKVKLVSITIDPEHDTPKVMKEYLERFHAKPGWEFLTGTRSDINTVMKAFDAYIPDKMSHMPLTLLLAPGETKWVRIFGLMSGSELLHECTKVGMK